MNIYSSSLTLLSLYKSNLITGERVFIYFLKLRCSPSDKDIRYQQQRKQGKNTRVGK